MRNGETGELLECSVCSDEVRGEEASLEVIGGARLTRSVLLIRQRLCTAYFHSSLSPLFLSLLWLIVDIVIVILSFFLLLFLRRQKLLSVVVVRLRQLWDFFCWDLLLSLFTFFLFLFLLPN